MNITEQLTYLAEAYENDEHVDISAYNYFQLALNEMERLAVVVAELGGDPGYEPMSDKYTSSTDKWKVRWWRAVERWQLYAEELYICVQFFNEHQLPPNQFPGVENWLKKIVDFKKARSHG